MAQTRVKTQKAQTCVCRVLKQGKNESQTWTGGIVAPLPKTPGTGGRNITVGVSPGRLGSLLRLAMGEKMLNKKGQEERVVEQLDQKEKWPP